MRRATAQVTVAEQEAELDKLLGQEIGEQDPVKRAKIHLKVVTAETKLAAARKILR